MAARVCPGDPTTEPVESSSDSDAEEEQQDIPSVLDVAEEMIGSVSAGLESLVGDSAKPPPGSKTAESASWKPRVRAKRPLTKVYWNPLDWCLGTPQGQATVLVIFAPILVISGALAWGGTGGNADTDDSFEQSMWLSWGLFFDPGTQTGLPADEDFNQKVCAATLLSSSTV